MANVLVATLGDYPIVVTAMFNLLQQEAEQGKIEKIDEVFVLHTEGDTRVYGHLIIDEFLRSQGKKVEEKDLPFEDVHNEREAFIFLNELLGVLYNYQIRGYNVYLSLAGGRKNLSAMMALVAPFRPCVKKLYHLLDSEEENNAITADMLWNLSEKKRASLLTPSSMSLIDIPFEDGLKISAIELEKILKPGSEELQKLWLENPDKAEGIQLMHSMINAPALLDVRVTQAVKDYYLEKIRFDDKRVKELEKDFKRLHSLEEVLPGLHSTITRKIDGKDITFHFFKQGQGDVRERIFFHTEPNDISNNSKSKVDTLIISGLAYKDDGYSQTDDELADLAVSSWLKPTYPIQDLFIESGDSILVVPLGIRPMIATQLYTLLTNQGRKIHDIILVYPGQAEEVLNGVRLLEASFKHENKEREKRKKAGIDYHLEPIADLEDIENEGDCRVYRTKLQEIIQGLQRKHTTWKIDLALTGGRKSMAALAVFAAQSTGLPYVYYTLIDNEALDQEVQDETDIDSLERLSDADKCQRLFLRTYKKNIEHFKVFKLPVRPILEK